MTARDRVSVYAVGGLIIALSLFCAVMWGADGWDACKDHLSTRWEEFLAGMEEGQ